MPRIRTLSSGSVSAVEYVCDATPADAPYTELHAGWSFSYVRRGSFGCQTRGQLHELVPGSVLMGQPGDEYLCTHDHHICGDECLAFFLAPELVEEWTGQAHAWQSGAMPALPELVVLGEMARAAVLGRNALGTTPPICRRPTATILKPCASSNKGDGPWPVFTKNLR